MVADTEATRPLSVASHDARASLTSGTTCGKDVLDVDASAKLNLASLPVFGRDEELQQLREAYHKAISSSDNDPAPTSGSRRLPLALLWGLSGTGKTRLVQQFVDDLKAKVGDDNDFQRLPAAGSNVQSSDNRRDQPCSEAPYFIRGKYDENTKQNDPFLAIIQALNDFCLQLSQAPERERERIRRLVRRSLGSRSGILAKLVPSVRSLLIGGASEDGPSTRILHDTRPVTDGFSTMSAVQQLDEQVDVGSAWNQLQYAFVSFIRAVSTKQRPVVMFLDDLQWSSNASLDLLSTLLLDNNLRYFFVVGAVRQVANPHFETEAMALDLKIPLSKMIRSLHATHPQLALDHSQSPHKDNEGAPFQWLDIMLSNLSIHSITTCLSTLLGRTVDDVESLVQQVYSRTRGNILFCLQLLEQLQRSGVLVYSHETSRWEWEWPDTSSATDSSGSRDDKHTSDRYIEALSVKNIAQLMTIKLKQLPPDLQDALICASYIRSTFDLPTLYAVLKTEQQHQSYACVSNSGPKLNISNTGPRKRVTLSQEELSRLLEHAVLEGLLTNEIGRSEYRFAHDRIQEASYEMVPLGEDRAKLRSRIGMCLYTCFLQSHFEGDSDLVGKHADTTEQDDTSIHSFGHKHRFDETLLFVAADHLNSTPTKDHLCIAKLNIQAGRLATDMAALDQACLYFQIASNALTKVRNAWESHYEMSMELLKNRAVVDLLLGRYASGYGLGQSVLERAKTLDEKLSTYASIAEALGRENRHKESMEVCQDVGQMLGSYPKGSYVLHIAKCWWKVRRYFRRRSDEQILRQATATNSRAIMSMQFLRQQQVRSFMCDSAVHYILPSLKIILLSEKHGLTEDVATAFSSYALIVGGAGNHQSSVRVMGLALKMLRRFDSKTLGSQIHIIAMMYVYPWIKPIGSQIMTMNSCYTACMSSGMFEEAFFCWSSDALTAQSEGYPLSDVYRSSQDCIRQMELYKVFSPIATMECLARFLRRLMKLEAVDWEEVTLLGKSLPLAVTANKFVPRVMSNLDLQLCVVMRQYEIAELVLEQFRAASKDDPAYSYITQGLLFEGIIAAARYRQTKRNKYLRTVAKVRREGNRLYRTRGPTCMNRWLIVHAEYCALTKSAKDKSSFAAVREAYDNAIYFSVESGRIHEAGMACELAGEYMLTKPKYCTRSDVMDYFSRSYEYYLQWGSSLKTDQLYERHGGYINTRLYYSTVEPDVGNSAGRKVIEGLYGACEGRQRPAFGTAKTLATFNHRKHYTLISSFSSPSSTDGSTKDGSSSGNRGDWTAAKTSKMSSVGAEDELLGVPENADDDNVSVLTDGS